MQLDDNNTISSTQVTRITKYRLRDCYVTQCHILYTNFIRIERQTVGRILEMEVLNICILYITVNTFFFFSSSSITSSRFSSAIILSSFFRTSKRTLLSTFSPETSHILISASSTYTDSNSKGSFYTGQNKIKKIKQTKNKKF